MTGEGKETALSRWSRRKLEAQQAASIEDPVDLADDPAPAELPIEASEAEAPPVLTDADMPALDSLTEESDYSGFMSSGVSDDLRNLALRKLFRASVFNIRDGLDEYDEDYTEFEKLGDIVTCDMKHQIEMQEKKRLEALAEAEETAEETADEIEVIEDIDDDAAREIESAAEIDEIENAEAQPAPGDEDEMRNE